MKQTLLKLLSVYTAFTPWGASATAHESPPHSEAHGTHSYTVGASDTREPTNVNVFIFPRVDDRIEGVMNTRVLRYLLSSAAEAIAREAAELRSPSAEESHTMLISKVDFTGIKDLEAVKAKIERECAAEGSFELDLANQALDAFWIEEFVKMLTSAEMKEYLPKIRRINLNNNLLGIRGVQEFIPLLRLDSLEILEILSNSIDSKDIHNLGTAEGDDEEMTREERVSLDRHDREKIVKKLIWLPKSYFNPSDANINPSGVYITPEIISRHREYFGFSTR